MQWWCIIVITPFAYKIFGWVAMHKKHFLHIKRGPAYEWKWHRHRRGTTTAPSSMGFSLAIPVNIFQRIFLFLVVFYIFLGHTQYFTLFLIFNPFSSTKLWLRLRGKLVSQINCIIIIDFFFRFISLLKQSILQLLSSFFSTKLNKIMFEILEYHFLSTISFFNPWKYFAIVFQTNDLLSKTILRSNQTKSYSYNIFILKNRWD